MNDAIIYPAFLPEHKGVSLVRKIKKDPLHYFINLGVSNGAYTWLSLRGSPILFLNDARAIEYVFNENDKNYHKGKYNEGVRPLLGYGVFLSEDELWRKQRRDAAPVFSAGNFGEFVNRMNEAIDRMFLRWDRQIENDALIDIKTETLRLTLDVVLRTLYHEESETALVHMQDSLGTMLGMAERRIWSFFNLPLSWMLRLPRYKNTLKFLDTLTYELINHRKQRKEYPEDLLSRLINAHADTPDGQKLLRDNVLSFLLAGHETTANALAWSLIELGRHTEIRDKIIAEIDDVTKGQTPTIEHVKSMAYTTQAFNEILRLYPPVWTMSRKTLNDDTLPLEDGRKIFVPKDATIMLCAYSVHRRESYWPDPESFTPERFTQDAARKRPKYSWFPYGGGPRLCLGFKFAETEAVLAMARIYQRYTLKLLPGQQIRPEPIITLRPDRPALFRVSRRIAPKTQ